MKYKLLGSAALAVALAVSSGAWANPKNSFSDHNSTWVDSDATSIAAGNVCVVCVGAGGGNNSGAQAGNSNDNDGSVHNGGSSNSDAKAWSESFNVSLEAVEIQTLVGYTTYNAQVATAAQTAAAGRDNYNTASISGGRATATASGDGVAQAGAAAGAGSLNVQGQSIAATGNVEF